MIEQPQVQQPEPLTKEETETLGKLQSNMFCQGLPLAKFITAENAKNWKNSLERLSRMIKFFREYHNITKDTGFCFLKVTETNLDQNSPFFGEVQEFIRPMELELAKKRTNTVGIAIEFDEMIKRGVADVPFATKYVNELLTICEQKEKEVVEIKPKEVQA